MEVFSSFGGGMVTQAHPEKLKDNQSIMIENADIIQGDVLQARGGYSLDSSCSVVNYGSMNELKDEGFTFESLSQFTFSDLITSFAKSIIEPIYYFHTMVQFKTEKITFSTLKTYTFDSLQKDGVVRPNTGDSQGLFRYYKDDNSFTDILAINGKLYIIVDKITYRKLVINNLSSFQTVKPIEAVQYRDKLYIATGSGIVIYDGTSAYMMTAYKPNGLEALYIGTNGYATDPTNYLQNTVGVGIAILGVTVDNRYGTTNNNVTFTAYTQAPAGTSLEFLFETKKLADAAYTTAQNWSTSNVLVKSFPSADDYMVQVSVRIASTTLTLNQYVVPKYTVSSTVNQKQEDDIDYNNLSACNRIFVHYDRLFIYGDDAHSDYLYISHLNNFTYFPRMNTLKVTDPLRGELQRVVRYKNFLLCFTNGSIQMIEGSSPTDYTITPVHTTLGTAFGHSVQIVKNYVAFVGNDNGIYILKSFNYASDDKLNVERLDEDIRDSISSLIGTSSKILSTITNNQYFLYIENDKQNYVYRFYYEYGVWVRDKIDLSFQTLSTLDNGVVSCDTNNGVVYKLRSDVFKDGKDKLYTMNVQSKSYNFNMPHHKKKLKQYQLITNLSSISSIMTTVYADNNLLITKPLNYDPNQNADAQKLNVMASGRFRCIKTEITIKVKEPVQLIGFGFVFKQNTPK
jgi:hypothetical protein